MSIVASVCIVDNHNYDTRMLNLVEENTKIS